MASSSATGSNDAPYNRHNLTWNAKHTQNLENKYCYCGKARTLTELTLQCGKCRNWFHKSCLSVDTGKMMPFFLDYSFTCKYCTENGQEKFEKLVTGWKSIITTALAHFIVTRSPERYFAKPDICPWIDKHWEAVTHKRDKTPTWEATVGTCLSTESGAKFICQDKVRSAGSKYTLTEENLLDLLPADSSGKRSSASEGLEPVRSKGQKRDKEDQSPSDSSKKQKLQKKGSPHVSKRRDDSRQSSSDVRKRKERESSPPPKPGNYYISKDAYKSVKKGFPVDHPFNRDGFRYTDAEVDLILSEDSEEIGLAFREKIGEPGVFISRSDRNQSIEMDSDRLTATTRKGYRMARATHSCNVGAWYFEVMINQPTSLHVELKDKAPEAHTRLGWARREAPLEAPVGFNKYSYSYRDLNGQKVHEAMPVDYGVGAGPGDVIGLYINLPDHGQSKESLKCENKRDRIPIKFKNGLFFEYEKKATPKEQEKTSEGSEIVFYVNGVSQGVAFSNIEHGDYYPSISLYMGANVTLNFGPNFRHPPKDREFRPFHERYEEEACLTTIFDIIDQVVKVTKNNPGSTDSTGSSHDTPSNTTGNVNGTAESNSIPPS